MTYLQRLLAMTTEIEPCACVASFEHGRRCPSDHVCMTPVEFLEAAATQEAARLLEFLGRVDG